MEAYDANKQHKKATATSLKTSMQSPSKTLPSSKELRRPTENSRNGAEYHQEEDMKRNNTEVAAGALNHYGYAASYKCGASSLSHTIT
jgi:hypothetical protein